MTLPDEVQPDGRGPSRLSLEAGPARAEVDLRWGARLASLTVDGHELLVGPTPDPLQWGSFPMVPYAGRVRHGRFRLEGEDHQLPLTLAPHAIHGTAFDRPWHLEPSPPGALVMALDLGPPWPFPARVEQRVDLDPDRLRLRLRLVSRGRPGGPDMPAMVGWHPWFRRIVGGAQLSLEVEAGAMYELDPEGIPTGRLVPPGPEPWDHCFTGVTGGPGLRWPGVMELDLRSSCDHWVIYTHPAHALCVEPQTDAPDAFNRRPHRLGRGEALEAWFELRWRTP